MEKLGQVVKNITCTWKKMRKWQRMLRTLLPIQMCVTIFFPISPDPYFLSVIFFCQFFPSSRLCLLDLIFLEKTSNPLLHWIRCTDTLDISMSSCFIHNSQLCVIPSLCYTPPFLNFFVLTHTCRHPEQILPVNDSLILCCFFVYFVWSITLRLYTLKLY